MVYWDSNSTDIHPTPAEGTKPRDHVISSRAQVAKRANMLVLRTSNFQGATIRPIVPRHNTLLSLLFRLNFLPCAVQKSIRLQLNYFQLFEMKAVKSK